MKKVLSLVLALTMVFGLMSFAGAESSEPITITFWNGWTGSDGDVLIEKVDEFNDTNPYGITVEMDINAEFQTKIAATFAADEGPTMILGASNYPDMYGDYLIDMNEIFTETTLVKDDFITSYLDAMSRNGILYGVPFQVTGRYMYWNKDLFEAAGLDPDTPPATYAQWAEFAAQITNEDMNVYGSGIGYNGIFTNLQLLQRMGGLFVDFDADGNLKANFSGNEGYAYFLNWLKAMIDSGDNPLESDTESMFKAGQIGIMPDGAWLSAGADAAGINYGVAMLPYGDAGAMNPSSVTGFCVTKYATDAEKEAAYRFIDWWYEGYEDTETTGSLAWSLECGYPGYYLPAINDARYQASEKLALMTCTDPDASSTYMAPVAFTQTYLLAVEVIEAMIEDVVVDSQDANVALDNAQAEADKLLN
ncbi:MAG TPA: extracellular solute-binding protein [Candidatus Limiplasma sp.]|nr:extracellular solute-binding protein [Candidatus Limiplasma sp.]